MNVAAGWRGVSARIVALALSSACGTDPMAELGTGTSSGDDEDPEPGICEPESTAERSAGPDAEPEWWRSSNAPADCEFPSAVGAGVDCSRIERAVVLGSESLGGSGIAIDLRLEAHDHATLGEDYATCLRLVDEACQASDFVVAPAPSRALTAVVVTPLVDPEAHAKRLDEVLEFIASRPADEDVAVFRRGHALRQVATLGRDRERTEYLLRTRLGPALRAPLESEPALREVTTELSMVRRRTHRSLRALVWVGDELEAGARERAESWGLSVFVGGDDLVGRVGAELDRTLHAGQLRLAHCGGGSTSTIQIAGAQFEMALEAPGELTELAELECELDPSLLEPKVPEVIHFEFDVVQRIEFDQRLVELDKTPFELSVFTDQSPEDSRVAAKAKLRGNTSLECERKSFSLNLDGDVGRRWMPGSATDEFFLISMCLDDGYIQQYTANTLLREMGVFDLNFRFVELKIGDKSQGVYLLMEKPHDELRRVHTRPRAIVRRASDIQDEPPELKWSVDPPTQALHTYETLLERAREHPSGSLLEGLRSVMDIDQYMRWVATMTLFRSSDYIDETFFVATETVGPCSRIEDDFHINSWDPDDLFGDCHNGGEDALVDDLGILHCTESVLDHEIFADDEVYAHYQNVLAEVLGRIDPKRFSLAVEHMRASLETFMKVEDIRLAMVELIAEDPRASEEEGALAAIDERARAMQEAFVNQHAALRSALAGRR